MSMKISDILRADIRRLETELARTTEFLEHVMEKATMCEQALGVVIYQHHLDGVTITEEERVACGQATGFRVTIEFIAGEKAGEGSMVLRPKPITDEERKNLKTLTKKRGPDIILPGGA